MPSPNIKGQNKGQAQNGPISRHFFKQKSKDSPQKQQRTTLFSVVLVSNPHTKDAAISKLREGRYCERTLRPGGVPFTFNNPAARMMGVACILFPLRETGNRIEEFASVCAGSCTCPVACAMTHSTPLNARKGETQKDPAFSGADDGSRTHLIGLGSRSSTDELHPRVKGVYHAKEK